MARIPGFHPGGPGSIPGMGDSFLFLTRRYKVAFDLPLEKIQTFLLDINNGEALSSNNPISEYDLTNFPVVVLEFMASLFGYP